MAVPQVSWEAEQSAERDRLAGLIHKGFWGDQDDIGRGEAALAVLIRNLDDMAAAISRYRAQYGEAVADP